MDKIRRLDEKINAYGSIVTELHYRVTNLEKAERKIEIALENVKELEIQISDLTLKVEMLDSLNSDIIADFNDLKEQFGLMQIEKEKVENTIYEETLEQTIKNTTNEIKKALIALKNELSK